MVRCERSPIYFGRLELDPLPETGAGAIHFRCMSQTPTNRSAAPARRDPLNGARATPNQQKASTMSALIC